MSLLGCKVMASSPSSCRKSNELGMVSIRLSLLVEDSTGVYESLSIHIYSCLFLSIHIYSCAFLSIHIHIYIISMHVHAQLIQFIQLKLIRRTQIPFDTPTRWCASHRVQLYSSSSSSSLASSCACTSVTRTRPQ